MPADSPMNNFSDYEISDDGPEDFGSESEEIDSDSSEAMERNPPGGVLSYDPNQLSHHPGGLPINGHDYLKQVQEEREKLPAVLSAKKAPPPAPHKTRDFNESQNGLYFEETQQSLEKSQDCERTETSIYLDTSSSSEGDEQSSREQFGIMPLSKSMNTSIDKSSDQSNQADTLAEALSNLNQSTSSIKSSKLFREKIKLRKNLLDQQAHDVSMASNSTIVHDVNSDKKSIKSLSDAKYCSQILIGFNELRTTIAQQRGNISVSKISDRRAQLIADGEVSEDEVMDEEQQVERSRLAHNNYKQAELVADRAIWNMNFGKVPEDLHTLDQLTIHLILEKMAKEYEKSPNHHAMHADWVYSLMACLQEPIDGEICATLRRLAKSCIVRRNKLERKLAALNGDEVVDMDCDTGGQSSAQAASLNPIEKSKFEKEEYLACILIICLVHHVFGQTDLR